MSAVSFSVMTWHSCVRSCQRRCMYLHRAACLRPAPAESANLSSMASWIAGRTRPYSSSPTILITSLTSLLVRASSTAGERAKRSADFFLSFLAERSLTKDGVVPAPVEKAVSTNYYSTCTSTSSSTSMDVCLLSTTLKER